MKPEDILQLMKDRRSVRSFQKKLIPDEIITQILEAARWCQSASNVQPWRFIVIKQMDLLQKIAKLAPYGKFVAEVPVALAIVADTDAAPKWYLQDTSMLTHQICLMAWAFGIGTCWIGSVDREKAAQLLQLKSHEYLTTILPLGFPTNPKIPPTSRKDLSTLVSYLN
jgi:nitroreductase